MTRDQKLQRWAEREIERNINHLILDDQDGCLLAFGEYSIVPCEDHVQVLRNGELLGCFSSRRIALSWCVSQRKKLLQLSERIDHTDAAVRALRQDIRARRALAARIRDRQQARVIMDKLQQKQWYMHMLQNELEKCAERAKYLQLRGSTHETARTRAA